MKALPHARALLVDQAPPTRAPRAASHLPPQHLPGNAGAKDEEDAAQNGAVRNRGAAMPMAAFGTALRQQRCQPRPNRIVDEGLRHARPHQVAHLGTRGELETFETRS
jgi:hypothetical protein